MLPLSKTKIDPPRTKASNTGKENTLSQMAAVALIDGPAAVTEGEGKCELATRSDATAQTIAV